jgi:hypothetical protein
LWSAQVLTKKSLSVANSKQSTMAPWNGFLAGALVWLVPFAVSCLFVDPKTGQFTIDRDWFRVVMMSCGSATALYATAKVAPQNAKAGWICAAQFLVVNWLLDLLVLVPLMASSGGKKVGVMPGGAAWVATVPVWFKEIGATYNAFCTLCVAAGQAAGAGKKQKRS